MKNKYIIAASLLSLNACSTNINDCITDICKRPLSNEQYLVVWIPNHNADKDFIKVSMKELAFEPNNAR